MQKLIQMMGMGLLLMSIVSCADHIVESTATVFDDPGNTSESLSIRARFSSIQDSVFSVSCALSGCHNGTQPPNLSAGRAYDNIVNVPSIETSLDRVEPGDPASSYLFRKISGVNIVGGRMPLNRPPLSQSVIDSIGAWIARGAPRD